LTESELEAVVDIKSMDEVMPRPTPDAQKELLDRLRNAPSKDENDVETLEDEFNIG